MTIRLTLLAAILGCPAAFAQDAHNTWPALTPDARVVIVTTARPGHRQNCHIQSADAAQITCSRRFGRESLVYQRQEIEALIGPAYHSNVYPLLLGFEGAAGGIFYGAVRLAPASVAGAIGVGVVGGIVAFLGLFGAAFGSDGDTPEHLLYVQPGYSLTVSLHN